MITTLEGFIAACENQNNNRIYEVFEYEIDENTYVQVMANLEDDDDPEPVRNALNALGRKRNIQSLIDY